MDFMQLRDNLISFNALRDAGCGSVRFNFFNPKTDVFENESVDGIIEIYSEFLSDIQRKCIYRAVCLHCLPRGKNGNLFRYAKYFAEEAINEITPFDLCYEIGFFYTKYHRPYVVEFVV